MEQDSAEKGSSVTVMTGILSSLCSLSYATQYIPNTFLGTSIPPMNNWLLFSI